MAAKNDRELVSQARRAAGASDASAIPNEAVDRELAAVKDTIRAEVREAAENGSINLYKGTAELEMAENLLKLRVAELRRQNETKARGKGPKTETPKRVPKKAVPENFGTLQRTKFEDSTLESWRRGAIKSRNRLRE